MSRRIRILPDRLVNQIAAGEVVERPASVVKELVENSLDAGATRISVSIRNGGKTEIRVSDDGHGMNREDALLCLDRHATSKLGDREDLDEIRTLGFRGEALPSIASVSRFTLETAEREGEGTRVSVNAGRIGDVSGCARRQGTTVVVRSLFHNVPARAKFLRSSAAEARAVSDVVTTLALAHPGVTFELESNGRELLSAGATTELRARIGALWGEEYAIQTVPVVSSTDTIRITGLVQRPGSATPGGRRAYLYVNGRSFADRAMLRAADRGYVTTIAPGVRPALFLFLEVPPERVDVNVHPTKAEVRFREPAAVEAALEEAVRSSLRTLESSAQLGTPIRVAETRLPWVSAPRPAADPGAPAAPEPAPQMSLFAAPAGDLPAAAPRDDTAPVESDPGPIRPVLWQVHNTYLFAETRSGLIIVDQHSAHERVLYEEIMGGYDAREPESQRLLFPLTLRLSPAEVGVVEELSGLLTRIGFEIEPFGGNTVVVHAVPQPHPYFDAERCLREMVTELTRGSPLVDAARNQHQRLALTFACKGAIKAGQRLSQAEMGELFDRLFATELPYHDIHGRPTIVQLPLAEIHSRFRR
ncbi:MAG TPA: DNA mismatch repair endonuclease MutL [Longimicrobiaceae bacterium]